MRDASGHWEWFDWKKQCLYQISLLGEITKRCSKVCLVLFVLFFFFLNTTGVGYFAMPRMILTGGLLGSYEGEQPGELLR